MRHYELVLLLHARSSENDRKTLVESIEKLFPTAFLAKDDMGVMDLAFALQDDKELTKTYFISYHLDLEPAAIARIKQDMKYIKGVVRYFFYSLEGKDKFVTYKETQTAVEELLVKKNDVLKKKNDIFAHATQAKYLTRKAFTLLKAFITRFDEIKPRKFSTHTVTVQKKLRKCIIRARELGLIPYVKK